MNLTNFRLDTIQHSTLYAEIMTKVALEHF